MSGAIDWNTVRYFNPKIDKFSEDPDLHASPQLIYDLDTYRGMLGVPINPSPAPGALARFDGSKGSQHYAVGRKSSAIDIFVNRDNITRAWLIAVTCGLWGGVGIYPTTKYRGVTWPMMHLDKRNIPDAGPLCWVRLKTGKYVYARSERDVLTVLGGVIRDQLDPILAT